METLGQIINKDDLVANIERLTHLVQKNIENFKTNDVFNSEFEVQFEPVKVSHFKEKIELLEETVKRFKSELES